MSQLCITLVYRGQSDAMKCRILSGGLFRGETDLMEESLIEKTVALPADRVHIFVKTLPSPESHDTSGMSDVDLGSTQLSDVLSVLPVWRVFEQVDHTISIRIKVYDEFMTYVMRRLDEKPMTVTASTPPDHAAGEPGSDLVLGDFKYHDMRVCFTCARDESRYYVVYTERDLPEDRQDFSDIGPARIEFQMRCLNVLSRTSRSMVIEYMQRHAQQATGD